MKLTLLFLLQLILSSCSANIHITASDDIANTTISWFNIQIFPTPLKVSSETAEQVLSEMRAILDVEFINIYYNFKNFDFENPSSTPLSRSNDRKLHQRVNLRDLNISPRNAASRDTPSDIDIEIGDRSRYLQDTLNLELGTEITVGGHIVFFCQPTQSRHKVDSALASTLNSPSINSKLISSLKNTGNPSLSEVYSVKAVPYHSESPSVAPSKSPSSLSSTPSATPSKPQIIARGSSISVSPLNEDESTYNIYPPVIAVVAVIVALVALGLITRRKTSKRTITYKEFKENRSVSTFSDTDVL